MGFGVTRQSIQVVVGDDEIVAIVVTLEVAELVGQVSIYSGDVGSVEDQSCQITLQVPDVGINNS